MSEKAKTGELLTAKDAKTLEEVRKKILDLKKNITKTYIDLARLLAYVREATVNHKPIYIHFGYKTFEEYCDKELNMAVRKAQMLIEISRFVDKLLAGEKNKEVETAILAELDAIGWVKAYLLPRVVNNTKDFFPWAKKAKELGKKEFKELVMGRPSVDIDDGKPVRFEPMHFKIISSGVDIVKSALEHVRAVNGENIISGPAGDGMLLVRLCQHYLSNLKDGSGNVQELIKSIVANYDGIVSIRVTYDDGQTEEYRKGDANVNKDD